MTDEDLGRMLRGLFNWVKAGAILGMFTLGILVMTHWDKTLLRRGSPAPKEDTTECETEAKKPAVQSHRPPRRTAGTPKPPAEETSSGEIENEQAAPVMASNTDMRMPAPPPTVAPSVVVFVTPEIQHPRKKHHWPRRLFGAIGRGFGTVLGLR